MSLFQSTRYIERPMSTSEVLTLYCSPEHADDSGKSKAELIEELQELRHKMAAVPADDGGLSGCERTLLQIASQVNEVIFMFTPDWREAIYVSPAYDRIWGRPAGEVYHDARAWMMAIVPEDRDQMAAIIEGQARGEIPTEISADFRIRAPDGRVRWINGRTYPVRDEEGNVTHIAGIAEDITERRNAEDRLRDSEKFLNNIFDCFQDGISVLDKDLNIVRVNHMMEEWYPHMKPLAGKKCYNVYHGRSVPCERCPSMRAMATGTLQTETVKHEGENNEQKGWQEVYAFPLEDEAGNVIGVIEHVRDVTGRKQAEYALRESEEKYRSLAENINDMVWEMDSNYRVTYASARTPDLMGYEVREIIGKQPFDFIVPEDIDRFGAIMDKAVQARAALELVGYRVRRKDGRIVYFETNGMPIFNADGSFRGYRGINRDITERKRAEEALKESERKFRALAETTNAGIALYRDKKFVYVNPMLEAISGYTKDELLAMNFWDSVHPEHRELVRGRGLARQLGRDVPSTYEFKMLTKQGETKWVELYATPIEYEGKPTIISTVYDITERKRAEQELHDAKEQAELYLDLMGHDINNLNQISIGFLETALGTLNLDPGSRDLIARPLEAIEASSRLIANVRKLRQSKEGGLKFRKIRIADKLREIVPRYGDVRGRDIRITCDADNDCMVMANDLLDDVFANIIHNAIKHSTGRLAIDVHLSKAKVGDQEYAIVAIEDNGPGIPDKLKERVFTRSERSKSRPDGKGLGLYLVRTLVEGFHGKVWVEDRVMGDYTMGTRFIIMLPAIAGHEREE